jgi:glucokinase
MGIDGIFTHLEKHPTPIHRSNKIEDFLLSHIRTIIEQHGNRKIEGIGLGTGGVVNPQTGTIIHATPLLPGWQGTPIKDILQKEFQIRARVDNDGNMAALGEYLFGSGKGTQNLVFIAIGTGVGGGAILDRKVFRGVSGAAMNIGHICVEKNGLPCNCGQKGCLEAYASGKAIEMTYAKRLEKQSGRNAHAHPTAQEIFQFMKKGEPIATDIIDTALDFLAIGIMNIIELFDPELIVLGGGVGESLAPMLNGLRSRVSSSTGSFNKEKIKISRLGQTATLAGAAGAILFE